jgi:4-aminobutyrate aminotransferase-like enzyme
MVAVDLVDDQGQPLATDRLKQVIKLLGKRGVVMTKCGPSALRLAPALILTEAQADEVATLILDALAELS